MGWKSIVCSKDTTHAMYDQFVLLPSGRFFFFLCHTEECKDPNAKGLINTVFNEGAKNKAVCRA